MNSRAVPDPHLDLLRRTADGDRAAFRELYRLTSERVGVYIHRLTGRDEMVEDVLVQTFTTVWTRAASFRGRSLVITWIIGIARNLACKEMRQWSFHDNIDDHPGLTARSVLLEERDRRQVLDRALGAISRQHREVLDLAFYQDLPYKEIALLLDIPVNTVKTRVFHAKAALKKQFDRMGISADDL